MIAGSNLRKNGRLSLLLLGSALLAALGSLLGLSLGFLGATFLGFAFRLSGDGFASATLGSHFESWICNLVRVCVLHTCIDAVTKIRCQQNQHQNRIELCRNVMKRCDDRL